MLLEEESSIFTLKARAALKRIDMHESERSELARKFALMADLDIHIKDVERVIKLDLPAHSAGGELARFPNGRALAAYAGVLPLDNESADPEGPHVRRSGPAGKDLGKHTGSHSNRFLRWILLEAVNGAVKKSRRMKSLLERVKGRNRNAPGKARVAVARELAELAHLLLSRRVLFTETPPPRPGSPEAVAAAKKSQRGKRPSPQPPRKRARKRKRRLSATSKG